MIWQLQRYDSQQMAAVFWPLKSPGLVGPGLTEFLTSDSKWLPGETGEYRTIAQETYPNQMCWSDTANQTVFFVCFTSYSNQILPKNIY